MNQIFQIPAIFNKFESKANGAVKLVFTTQDGVRSDLLHTIISLIDNAGFLNFAVRMLEADDLVNLPKPDANKFPGQKTQSQRQRAVIYRLWEQAGKPGDWEEYYKNTMERIINQLKGNLD
jgi:hypothetical protein